MLDNGLFEASEEGTPQGGPLSPLALDELDRELERRGHRFVRYADDCNIDVRSEKAGRRVMQSVTRFIERRLKPQVNAAKSAVDRPWRRSFLSFTLRNEPELRRCIAAKADPTDERERETGRRRMAQATAPFLDSTVIWAVRDRGSRQSVSLTQRSQLCAASEVNRSC